MAARRTTKAGLKKKKRTFTKFISVFKNEVELHSFKCNKEIAKAISEDAKVAIEKQSYNWKPLSPKYLDDKLKKGYDPRIYIRSGEFLNAISWGVTNQKLWTGIPSRIMHTGKFERADEPDRKPIKMSLLARWLEFGTVKMPPRPIWRPLLAKYARTKPEFGKRYRKAMDRAVKRKAKAAKK